MGVLRHIFSPATNCTYVGDTFRHPHAQLDTWRQNVLQIRFGVTKCEDLDNVCSYMTPNVLAETIKQKNKIKQPKLFYACKSPDQTSGHT